MSNETPTPYVMKQRFLLCHYCKEEFGETDSFVQISTEYRSRLYHHHCFDSIIERLYTLTRFTEKTVQRRRNAVLQPL